MAVDTAEKRYAMMQFVCPVVTPIPMFEPDGSVDSDDRFHLLNLYPVTAPAAAVIPQRTLLGVGT